jgi:hypothetical protein
MNCDLNMYSHIPYKPYKIVSIGKFFFLQKNLFMLDKGVNCLKILHGLF